MKKLICKECGEKYTGTIIDSMMKNGLGICKKCARKIIELEKKSKKSENNSHLFHFSLDIKK